VYHEAGKKTEYPKEAPVMSDSEAARMLERRQKHLISLLESKRGYHVNFIRAEVAALSVALSAIEDRRKFLLVGRFTPHEAALPAEAKTS
jgi:hypothetical protein